MKNTFKSKLNKIIKEEVQKEKSKKLTEGLLTKMFDYVEKVTTKGKLDYATKKVADENPEFANALKSLSDASNKAMEVVNKMTDDEKKEFYKKMDDMGF